MVFATRARVSIATFVWPLLAFGIVLGLGFWGATRLADKSTRYKKAAFGCLVGGIASLAAANAVLLSALLVSRRRHRELREALLPEVRQSLRGEDGPPFGRGAADTPASLLLAMMGDLLAGRMPVLRDVVGIRQALMSNMDVYQPFNLRDTITGANLDTDVALSLMRQLGGDSMLSSSRTATMRGSLGAAGATLAGRRAKTLPSLYGSGDGGATAAGDFALLPRGVSAAQVAGASQQDCDSLTSALALILTAQPAAWQDGGGGGGGGSCGLGGGADDMTGELAAVLTDQKPPAPPPSASGVERRTPNSGGSAMGLLEKAVNMIDRSRRRARRASNEAPPVAAVVDVGRDLDAPTCASSYTAGAGTKGRHGSAAGIGSGLGFGAGHLGGGRSERPDSSQQRGFTLGHSAVTDTDNAAGSNAVSVGGGGATGDDNSATIATVDGESLGGGGGGPPPGEVPMPRRLSAMWGMRSKRGIGGVRDISLDEKPDRVLAAAAGRASPASGPSSFSGLSVHSLQTATGLGAAEPGQAPNRRRGLGGGGGGGGRLFRTASFRAVALSRGNSVNGAAATAAAAAAAAAAAEAIKRSTPPPPAVIDEVERLLAGADGWQFNTWALQEATRGHALSALGFFLMQRAGLVKTFRIKPVTLARTLRQIEAGYLGNPYHNAVHAADVLQTLHVILHYTQLHVHYLDPLGLMAAYYAAVVHDYAHPGLTNDFLIATSDPLAVRYNDRSPLENHHCAASFGLMQRPELDFLEPLSKADRAAFRKQVIELVLATDMKQHFSILSHFNTVHRLSAYSQQQQQQQQRQQQQQQQASPTPGKLKNKKLRRPTSRALSAITDHTPDVAASTTCPAFTTGWSEAAPRPVDDTERLLSLQVALKAADIGHLGEDLEVHKRWLAVLEEEFFRQGDRERHLGLPISPLFDRAKQGVGKSQVGFYDFVALPLVHALSSAFPGAAQLMKCFMANYNHWRVVDGQAPVDILTSKPDDGRRSWQLQQVAAAVAASASTAGVTRVSEELGGGLGKLLLTVPDELEGLEGGDAKV